MLDSYTVDAIIAPTPKQPARNIKLTAVVNSLVAILLSSYEDSNVFMYTVI
jgi:hypothetical protein